MRNGELGPLGDGAKPELDKRLAGIRDAARPAPGHAQPLGPHDFEIFAAALMLAAVEHTEAHAETATNLRIELRYQHGTRIGPPPAGDPFWCCERIEDN